MEETHELAERLEEKRLTWLRLNLFGFAFGGLFRIIQEYALSSEDNIVLTSLTLLGAGIWIFSLLKLLAVGRKIEADSALKNYFNDELAVYNRLKAWKVGFFAVLLTQMVLVAISVFQSYSGLFAAELTIYVGICAAIGASIVQEELLAISRFQMEIDEGKYEIWNWKTVSFFHWIINPGITFNELLLGQRVPKVMLIDKQSTKPLMERTYTPCPSCETLHSNHVWSPQNKTAFKNYFGLYCPNCGEVIPCLRNGFSVILIALTYPLWFWRKEAQLRKWLARQPARFENVSLEPIEFKEVNWRKMGIIFGVTMFVFMTIVTKLIMLFVLDEEVTDYATYFLDPAIIIINAIVWPIAAYFFVFMMKKIMNRKSEEGASFLTKKIIK